MKLLTAAIILASTVSCATVPLSSRVRSYAKLENLVGREVTRVGYWSADHEATGIYFGKRDYHDAPQQCVMVDAILTLSHRSPVRASGLLEENGCGNDLIWLTTCQS